MYGVRVCCAVCDVCVVCVQCVCSCAVCGVLPAVRSGVKGAVCAVCGVQCVGAVYGWCVVWRAERHSFVDSKRYRACIQNVSVCAGKTSTLFQHPDVLAEHTETC